MKSYIAAAALLAVANAQSLENAPACVQLCVNNMLGMAGALGCVATDAACLCANVNFGYGVRDCSQAVCQNAADVQTGLALLDSAYCARVASSASAAGSSISSQAAVGSSVLAGVSSVPVSTEGSYTTITTDGSTITSLVSASNTLYGFVTVGTDSAGSAYTSTITGTGAGALVTTGTNSDGSTYTSTIAGAGAFVTTGTNSDGSTYTSTLTGAAASSAESAAAAASSGASSGASSASESASSVASGASESASSVASSASSRASSATSAAGSATSASSAGGAAPMITMAANGVAGLAGLAAVMLL